jgi:hypothetical protein
MLHTVNISDSYPYLPVFFFIENNGKLCEKLVRQPGGIVPTQFGHFPSPGAVTALKEKVRIDNSKKTLPCRIRNFLARSYPDPE